MKAVKNIIIIVIIAVIAYFAYTFFFKKSDTGSTGTLVTTEGTPAVAVQPVGTTGMNQIEVGNEFLTTLLSVNKITLDGSIFTSNVFKSLKDYHVTLVSEGNEGRPNPFAPIGVDTSTTVSVDSTITNEATDISGTIATLNGNISSSGQISSTWFEWGTTKKLGKRTAGNSEAIIPGTFQETLTGLLPNTTYYFRAAAMVGNNSVYGEILNFSTTQ